MDEEKQIIIVGNGQRSGKRLQTILVEIGLNVEEFADALKKLIDDVFDSVVPSFVACMDYLEGLNDSFDYEQDKHLNGVYSQPKMQEYYKRQPNQINKNKNIRKARNRLK